VREKTCVWHIFSLLARPEAVFISKLRSVCKMKCMKFSAKQRGIFLASAFAFPLMLIASPAISAQQAVPRLEPAECPLERGEWARDAKIECKWLVVSEHRGDPKSRTIKLAVMIFRARQPDGRPPLVFLHGGPGNSGILGFRQPAVRFSQVRDVVLYDQQGNGFSEPKLCPEFNASCGNRRP
jgi:hypothetical protein